MLPAAAAGLIAAAMWSPALPFNFVGWLQGYEVAQDIAYAAGERQQLDVYRPAGKGPEAAAPVLVFFYGGSWQTGSKAIYRFLGGTLAAHGYVVVIADYRLYPEVRFPEFLIDGARAVRWAHDHAREHGGDPARMFIMGHSAGAHIAAMLTLDDQWLRGVGLRAADDVAGLIGVSGPYDFLPLQDETLKVIFGGDRRRETQPINFAKGGKPPSLLMTGDDDEVVLPRNSLNLADKLKREGNVARAVLYPGYGHVGIMMGFAPFLAGRRPMLADLDTFVQDTAAHRRPRSVGAAK